jgi:hypothetical protein
MLHVTNGNSAIEAIRGAGILGEFVAWRDALHEGPVPADTRLEILAPLRARFIADQGWADYDSALADFERRDEALRAFAEHDEVVLWFEHDLYDQLQILEILAHFAGVALGATRLRMLCIDRHPEVPGFRGLGQLDAEQVKALDGQGRRLTEPINWSRSFRFAPPVCAFALPLP